MRGQWIRKLRFVLVYPLLIWLLIVAHTTERLLHLGIGLVAFGEGVRLWANGYVGHAKVNWTQKWRGDAKVGRLITGGPYAFVRHPLYFGTLLIGAGFCVIAGNVWAVAAALAFFLLVYRRKMAEEETMLEDELGENFRAYQRTVPRWVPGLRPYPQRQGQWSWQGIVASKEWKTLIWVVVIVILFYLREELFQEHAWLAETHWLKLTLILAAGILLMLTDGVIELVRRRRALEPVEGARADAA